MNNVYNITSIILAAGEGKRMYSKTPKVLHKVCGFSMVEHVMQCAREATDSEPVVVIGHGADQVKEQFPYMNYVMQTEQLGTGHAVLQADAYINEGDILILYGDTPLLRAETLKEMYKTHKENGYAATILTADLENPFGYGRMIRNSQQTDLIDAIVEERDADSQQKKINEINSGIYYFDGKELKTALKELKNENAQGEYYLTDVIEIFRNRGFKIGAYKISDQEEIMGVNNRLQLSQAEEIMKKRIIEGHLLAGVTIMDPQNTYIDKKVKIERDVILYPGCILEGNTYIEEDAEIGPNSRIKDSRISRGVSVQNSVVLESSIGEESTVGPFAYLRPGNKIGKHVKVGDFVEMKNSTFGDYSKASHLTYIGDGDVGENVNLGCGVVFVNYDGKKKFRSSVGDNAFIGCNVNLIAPVKVGANSYVAAGTTITKDIPDDTLAIGRARQENKEGWVKK